MKICKVEIVKQITGNDESCVNVYPRGYDADTINVISYEDKDWEEGNMVSYLIATVPDNFTFTDKMVEVSKEEADTCIDDRAAYGEVEARRKEGSTDGDALACKAKWESRKLDLPTR